MKSGSDLPALRTVAIFDGDNTLWDTNKVFMAAQKLILKRLAESGYPADPERDFSLLRRIDDSLVQVTGTHEYDSTLLPFYLLRHFRGYPTQQFRSQLPVDDSISADDIKYAEVLGDEFRENSQHFPPLFPEVTRVLGSLRQQQRAVLVLYSEGNESRIRSIYNHHHMADYFHQIFVGDKSPADWKWVHQRALALFSNVSGQIDTVPTIFVIGDRLNRDIGPGNLIGAVTVYKPGGYKGVETPKKAEDTPSFTITSLDQLLELI